MRARYVLTCGLQLYVHRNRLIRVNRDILFNKFIAVIGYDQMVRTYGNLDRPTAWTNRPVVHEGVSLLWSNAYLYSPRLGVLCKGGYAQ